MANNGAMQPHIIDIEDEKAKLWAKIYKIVAQLIPVSQPIQINTDTLGIVHIEKGDSNTLLLTNCDGEHYLFEEYEDDALFDIYNSLINA